LNRLSKFLGYLTLYGAHGLRVFSFILLIPHFTAIFPKSTWGQILIIQALALWFQIIVEYGFNLSATRSMSRVRDDTVALADLVAGVAGAKLILSSAVVILAFIASFTLSAAQSFGQILAWSTFFAITQGFNPVWYFLARGQFKQYALIDFCSRLLYLFLCLIFITQPDQGQRIFIFGVITAMFANVAGYFLMSRQIPLKFPKMVSSMMALREGFGLFVFVGITSVYTTLNIVILGFSQTTALVAAYGTSDRIVRAAGGLLDPLNRVIYAKLTHLYHNDFPSALIYLRKAAWALFAAGTLIFVAGEIAVPFIIKVLAPGYTDAIVMLRLLLIFIPVLAINNIVGLHIMLPLGMDRPFNTVFISVSIFSGLSMVWLVPQYGVFGMIAITILTEVFASLGMIYMIWKSGKFSANSIAELSRA
jgi:polysaccharide transporter, PST family